MGCAGGIPESWTSCPACRFGTNASDSEYPASFVASLNSVGFRCHKHEWASLCRACYNKIKNINMFPMFVISFRAQTTRNEDPPLSNYNETNAGVPLELTWVCLHPIRNEDRSPHRPVRRSYLRVGEGSGPQCGSDGGTPRSIPGAHAHWSRCSSTLGILIAGRWCSK